MSKLTSHHDAAPLLLTEREVARALGVSARTVWTLADSGELAVVRLGRRIKRYDLRDIQALIDARKDRGKAAEG